MEIMDDLLDLKDSLEDALGRRRRRAGRMLRGESGFSTLVTVLAIMAVGAIIITPLLAFVITGTRAGRTHNEITDRFYAADAGIQDGIWRVCDGDFPDGWKGTWNDAVYSDSYTYSVPDVNGCHVNVAIQPIWLLSGLEQPNGAQGRTPDPRLVTTNNVLEGGKMQVVVIMDSSIQGNARIDRIGVWLPRGYTYTMGSSDLEKLASGHAARCIPTVSEWKNGQLVLFDYSTPVSFSSFPDSNRTGNRLVISFSYTGTGAATGSWAWCRTSPASTSYYLAWSNDIKIFQVTSTATDPVTGASTSVVAGQMTNESVGTYLAYYGDYTVTGNALMRETGTDKVRDRLYRESPGQISVIPGSGTARKILLYWSGWKEQPKDAWFGQNTPDITKWPEAKRTLLHQLAVTYGVTQVSVRAVYNNTNYNLGTVTATEWTVLPNGSSSSKNGWSYGCNCDITNLVKSSLPADFVGNATYWVGHADIHGAAPTNQTFQGIWGSSASDIYVVSPAGKIHHYDGTSWSAQTSGSSDLRGVWGSSSSDVWAVGNQYSTGSWWSTTYHYTLLHTTNGGVTWTNPGDGMTSDVKDLNGVWGTAANNVWAVGADGKILRYNGTSWSTMTSGTTNNLCGVWGTAANNVWTVGSGGKIGYYNGANWSFTTQGNRDFYGVWGSAANDVYAVGANGTIYRYNGASWSAMASGTSQTLYGVWGSAANNVYAVGAGGTVLHYNGASWSAMASGTSQTLYGAWGSSDTDVYVVGQKTASASTMLHWDGSGWTLLGTGTSLYGWVNGNPKNGETVSAMTDLPLSDVVNNEWANACWSIVTLYTSPVTPAHQMYLFNTFRYWNSNDDVTFPLDGFLAPQGVYGEGEAVKLTYFVGEGDSWYGGGDNLYLNGTKLNPSYITPSTAAPDGNAMNSTSNSGGITGYPPNDGIDLDTYVIPGSAHLIKPADSSATVRLKTGTDVWNMVYMIMAFRSDNVGSGVLTYVVI